MAKNIDPELRKIGTFLELEDDAVFTIPEYQRAYSWGIEQCDKLWNDIVDFADIADNPDNERYFFGTIIINCEDGDDKLELIDGQQRTTTFLLLLKAILMCLNTTIKNASNDEEAIKLYRALQDHRRTLMKLLYKAKVENIPDEPDSDADKVIYQNTNILINNSINEQYKEELTAILKSTDFTDAENKVYKYPRKQKDNKYTNYFRNFKYLYNKVSTESESRLNIIIQTLLRRCEVIEIKSWKVEQAVEMFNSLNSDGLPLNDADIISAHLFKIAKSNNELEQYIAKWEELAIQIEKLDKLKISSIDSILMQQMYFERAVDKLMLSNSDSVNVTTPGVRRYFKVLNKKSTKEPVKLCDDMLNLAKIWEIIYDYPVTQVIFKFNENFKLFLASYLHRFKSDDVLEDQIVPVIKALLKLFVILEVVDTGYSSSKFKSFLFSEELKLVDQSITIKEIIDDFNNHIKQNWNKDDIKNEIIDYNKNSLVYLNEYLLAEDQGLSFDLKNGYDIEHIMPSSGKNIKTIRQDADVADDDEFKYYVNKVGNKILLESNINRAIGNDWFRTKISTTIFDKTGYKDSIYPSAKYLVKKYESNSKPFWTKEDIARTTNNIAERIVKFIFED